MSILEHSMPVLKHNMLLEQKNSVTEGEIAKLAQLEIFWTNFKIA